MSSRTSKVAWLVGEYEERCTELLYLLVSTVDLEQLSVRTWAPGVEEDVHWMSVLITKHFTFVVQFDNAVELEVPLGHYAVGRGEDSHLDSVTLGTNSLGTPLAGFVHIREHEGDSRSLALHRV